VRHGAGMFYFETGDREEEVAAAFARQIDDLLRQHGGGNRRIAIDKMEIHGVRALEKLDIEIFSGQEVCEHARVIKGVDEINAMRCAVATCEIAMQAMEDTVQPGMTEVECWSVLQAENFKRGGEWIETRILNSGPRSNPWMQECGPRKIQHGDIFAFDTDLIGPYGMCADLSRTWLTGDAKPTDEQRRLYQIAHEHIQTNRELVKPGVSFKELTFGGHMLPQEFVAQRYGVKFHGVGLCDEFPAIYYPEDYTDGAFDYELKPGMMLCVEVYLGAVGGREGIKLEDQLLVTETGREDLSTYHFDERLLASD